MDGNCQKEIHFRTVLQLFSSAENDETTRRDIWTMPKIGCCWRSNFKISKSKNRERVSLPQLCLVVCGQSFQRKLITLAKELGKMILLCRSVAKNILCYELHVVVPLTLLIVI